ncbi:glycosyltransferase [Paucibacter sp. Y2R2-4]|nr:glycosyltransferase [Paucibacter sp. Y2R2-4]
MEALPTVTVVMPVFNGAAYLAQAIDSILAQTFEHFELLVIDDGSSDKSAAIAAAYLDPRLKLVRNEGNKGLPYTRNRGIELARGEFVAFLDSDDVALPARLERQVEFLRANPSISGIGASAQPINADGTVSGADWVCPGDSAYCKASLLFKAYINTSTFFVRRHILEHCKFDPEILLAEDYDLYIRLSERCNLLNLPDRLVQCRVHTSNITRTKKEQLIRSQLVINRRQIERLGIIPTDEQVLIHRHIERLYADPTPQLFSEISDWIKLVLATNDKLGIYDPNALRLVVGERWHSLCEDALRAGATWAWKKYYSDSLSQFHPMGIKEHLKLAVRLFKPRRSTSI